MNDKSIIAPLGDALDCAVTAAEAGAQATLGIWQQMSPEERQHWIDTRGPDRWPPVGAFLRPVMVMAQQAIAHEEVFLGEPDGRQQ